MTEPVTHSYKRNTWEWIFCCANCGLMASSPRSDTLTCSPACRVQAHRSGEIKRLKAIAMQLALTDPRSGKPNVGMILRCNAVDALRPDLGEQLLAGTMTVFQAMPETYREFVRLAYSEVTL